MSVATSIARAFIGRLLDRAPAWIWREANLRFFGPHAVHFCVDDLGRRTVEVDGSVVAVGARASPPSE